MRPLNPIGVFDSGVGGLSVLRAVRDELPEEDLVYVADSAHAPYGDRAPQYIADRALAIAGFLLDERARALVVACNTATASAVDALRARFDVPIVAIEPAVKPAALRSRSRVVGVLTTTGTAESERMAKLLDKVRHGATANDEVRFIVQPAPGLADAVERGDLASDATRALVARYVRPLVEQSADVIVLGCTHYPFLRPLIQEVAGEGVDVIDPAGAVARELRRRLEAAAQATHHPPQTTHHQPGKVTFYTTGSAAAVESIIGQLWGMPVSVSHLER